MGTLRIPFDLLKHVKSFKYGSLNINRIGAHFYPVPSIIFF